MATQTSDLSRPVPAAATFAIAKFLSLTGAAIEYGEAIIRESNATGHAKNFLNIQNNKIRSAHRDILGRVKTSESKDALKDELADPLAIDALLDGWMMLTKEGREKLEDYIAQLLQTHKAD